MPKRGGRRIVAALAALGIVSLLVLVGPAGTAQATYATQCGSPTSTLDPAAGSVDIASGQTVLLAAGTFSGGVNSLPSGATLCVAPGATLRPAYLNNAVGSLVIASGGNAVFPSISVGTGFALGLEGTAVFAGLNINGSSTFTIAATGTLTVNGGFSPSAGTFDNAGLMVVNGAFNENSNVVVDNSNTLTVNGGANLNGTLNNSGTVDVTGQLTVNGGAAFTNSCRVSTTQALSNNSTASRNAGIVIVGGVFTNNGGWRQSVEGILTATGLTDDGTISGFGGYQFTGPTSAQGRFTGDAPGNPILVETQAPAGNIFDVQTGVITNVLRLPSSRAVTFESSPKPGCTGGNVPFADVSVTKAGPSTVIAGEDVTYTLTIVNAGPAAAIGTVVTDELPQQITGVTDTGGGTLGAGAIAWNLGTLAAGSTTTRTFTVSQASPVGTVFHDTARSISATPDPNPSNNNGTSAQSQADTTVVDVIPPNQAPAASPLVLPGLTHERLFGQVIASDPDPDQELAYTITAPPRHGRAVMVAGGYFIYQSEIDFTGDDSFVYTVCDDGSPVLCSDATVSLPISPIALDDTATTFAGTTVVIPVSANDSLGAALDPTLVSDPANGTVTIDPAAGTISYTPAVGFEGTDTFQYRQCSPTNGALCATATVVVTVLPVNNPPTVQPLSLTTRTGSPVTGTIIASDPDAGQTLAFADGIPPAAGTATVTGDQTTYLPRNDFAGTDGYTVIVCDDGDPILCSTGVVTVDVYPIANPDSASTMEGTSVTIPVTGNDLGSISVPRIATAPMHGTATTSGSFIVYTPDPGFSGTDTLTYTICASLAPTLCDTATVTIDIAAAPAPPIDPDRDGGTAGLADSGWSTPLWMPWAALATMIGGLIVIGSHSRRQSRGLEAGRSTAE